MQYQSKPTHPTHYPRLERPRSVYTRLGISRSYLYRKISEGTFPKPIKSGSLSYWLSTEVDRMIVAIARQATTEELIVLSCELMNER